MKEISCPECGNTFNDTEQACPNCGCPINTEETLYSKKRLKKQKSKDNFAAMQNKNTSKSFSNASLLPGESIVASAKFRIPPIRLIIIFLLFILVARLISDAYFAYVISRSLYY